MKPDKVIVACPKCGHAQPEPSSAYSTVCKKCRQHFRLQEVLHTAAVPVLALNQPLLKGEVKFITCFKCSTELEVPVTAQSTMCKRCSSHVDLRDYHITNAVSKNFTTKGRFVIEESGYLFNTETTASEVVIKGKFLGKLTAEQSLEIHSSGEIKGSFKAARLIIPAGQRFRWLAPMVLESAEISGELVANLQVEATLTLKSTARFFGDVRAGGLVVEEGAVFVGDAQIGKSKPVRLELAESAVEPAA